VESEEFSVTCEARDGHVVVAVRGELDELTAPELDGELARAVDGRPVVVDLSDVSFISSAGLHVLLKDRRPGKPAIVCPVGNVSRVLDIVGARRTTPVFPDLASALTSLGLGADGHSART